MNKEENPNLAYAIYENNDLNASKAFLALINHGRENYSVIKIDEKEYYDVNVKVSSILKKIKFTSRKATRIESLIEKVTRICESEIKFTHRENLSILPIVDFSYEGGKLYYKLQKEFCSIDKSFFSFEKFNEIVKLKSKYSFRLYQILYSNIKNGTYSINLNHINKIFNSKLENKELVRNIKKALAEITEVTNLDVFSGNIKVKMNEMDKRKIRKLVVKFSKKEQENKTKIIRIPKIEEAIKKVCKNEFINEKRVSNNNRFCNGIYKVVEKYGVDTVIRALDFAGKRLREKIKHTFQAYLIGVCKNNIVFSKNKRMKEIIKNDEEQEMIFEEIESLEDKLERENRIKNREKQEREKQEKIHEEEKAKKLEYELKKEKKIGEYEKLNKEEQEMILEKAKNNYLEKAGLEKMNEFVLKIFKKLEKNYIVDVMDIEAKIS